MGECVMFDIKIKSDDGNFKYRVSGALKHGDKYLFVKMNKNKFYCLPGGHVELGETAEEAAKREMEEELGFKVKVTKYLGEIQNFFMSLDGKPFHEVGKYFEVEAQNIDDVCLSDYERIENDKGFMQQLRFKWMTIEEAKAEFFRPECLLEILKAEQPLNLVLKEENFSRTKN